MRQYLGFLCLLATAGSVSAEDSLTIIRRMNEEGPKLHTFSADIHLLTFTAVIKDTLEEDGTLKMQRMKGGAFRAILDFSAVKGSAREIGLFGRTVTMYFPNAKYFQNYEFGKNGDLINQFLLLGFGASGDDLSKSYTISEEGTEKIAGLMTTKLQLIPKDPSVREKLTRAELWVPEGQANPIQQAFYEEPSGNYRKVTYSRMVLNPQMRGRLEIQMQPGTQKRN